MTAATGLGRRPSTAKIARALRDVHPPADEAPGPHFVLLEKIARENGLTGLSMGMSGDFELAVPFGATVVRVGSVVFGERVVR